MRETLRARPVDYDEIDDALSQGVVPAGLREGVAGVLEEIAAGAWRLRAVQHPLGFHCLPVLRSGERGVCIHLFESGTPTEPEAEPWHAHSWELRSYVLYGRVANLPVRVTEQPNAPTHRVYEVHSGAGGVDDIRPTGRLVHGEPGPEQASFQGDVYTLPAGRFHATVVAGEEPAATLVLGRTLPGHTDLSLGPLHGGGHRTVRRLCGAADTERSARRALGRIRDSHRR